MAAGLGLVVLVEVVAVVNLLLLLLPSFHWDHIRLWLVLAEPNWIPLAEVPLLTPPRFSQTEVRTDRLVVLAELVELDQ